MELLKQKYNFLSDKDILALSEISTTKSYSKNEDIISPFNMYKNFAFVNKGLIRGYYVDEQWEEINVFLVEENMFFTTPEYLTEYKKSKYTFEAVAEVELLIFNLKELEALSFENKNVHRLYTDALKFIIKTFVDRLEDLTTSPEKTFLNLHEKRPFLIRKAMKKYIAHFLGIAPSSLSRIKSRINKQN